MNRLLAFTLALLASGCVDDKQRQEGPPAGEPAAQQTKAEAAGQQFEDRLREIARTYESYGRFDANARWAPIPCAPFDRIPPSEPRFSVSRDEATHGRKLYSLFVKEVPAYTSPSFGEPGPVGQVVVKEAWAPEEVTDSDRPLGPVIRRVKVREGDRLVEREDRFLPYARREGRLYHAREKSALFIMFKLDPQTPGTDEGWVYGTVTADGRKVTSAGRVESCMGCHKDAPHDRLFGNPDH
jgi:hypothetical protein